MTETEYKLRVAHDYEKEGKLLHALQIYKPLLNESIYKRNACIRICSIYDQLNKFDSAMKILEDYLGKEPDDDNTRKFFGHLLIKHNRYREAVDILSFLSLEKNSDGYYILGIANFYIGEYEIAKINLIEFIKKNRKSDLLPNAYLFLAKIFVELNNLKEALEYAQSSEKLFSQNVETHLQIAIIYYMQEMDFHAYESVRKAIRLNNADITVLQWAGKILIRMCQFEKAAEHLQKAIEISDENAESFYLLGLAYLKWNKHKEAENYFHKVQKIDPSNQLVIEALVKCRHNLSSSLK